MLISQDMKYFMLDFTNFFMNNHILQENYDAKFTDYIYSLPEVTAQEVKRKARSDLQEVRVTYGHKNQFKEIAKVLGIMDDFRVSQTYLVE